LLSLSLLVFTLTRYCELFHTAVMKTGALSFALGAITLISSAGASPSLPKRALERRWDAPPLPPCYSYKPYQYVGCFVDASPKSLEYNPGLDFDTMTVETCTATCKVSLDCLPIMPRDESLNVNRYSVSPMDLDMPVWNITGNVSVVRTSLLPHRRAIVVFLAMATRPKHVVRTDASPSTGTPLIRPPISQR
jgi:hypothetical protein